MKKIAIFGNTGGGKSTLAKQLAEVTGLPLYPLDKIQYKFGGAKVSDDKYLKAHVELLRQEKWIIDGFGNITTAWERFGVADTLIYIDLPLMTHALWVTKRFFKGFIVNPEGWPDKSPLFKSTLNSYRVLWLCHRKLTPAYRKLVAESMESKNVYHLKSPADIQQFLDDIQSKNIL